MADGTRPRSSNCSQTYAIHHPPLVLETLRLPARESAASLDLSCSLPTVSRTKNANEARAVRVVPDFDKEGHLSQPLEGAELENEYETGLENREHAMVEPRTPEAKSRHKSFTSSPNGSATPRPTQHPITTPRSIPRSPVGNKTPPRQDSSYFSNQEHSDDDNSMAGSNLGVRRMRNRHEISLLRDKVQRTRRMVRGRRDKLSVLRENFRDAADVLMRRVNRTVAFGSIEKELGPDLEQLRKAQDALGLAENEYDDFERQLEQEERQLENEEIFFYDARSSSPSESGMDVESSLGQYVPRETESPFPNSDDEESEHDPVQEYLRKMAEAHYTREDLDALEEDAYRFSTDVEFRDKHDVWLPEEATSFLSDYPKRHVEIESSLQKVEAELFALRTLCIKDGLFAEDEHVYQPHDALLEDVWDSIYDAEDRSPLRLASSQVLLKEKEINYEDKRIFVNHWILKWVQDSTYECLLLKSWIFSTCLERLGSDEGLEHNWARLALENWDLDEAGSHADVFNSASMLDVIAGETRRINASIGISDFSGSSWRSSDIDLDDNPKLQQPPASSENGSFHTKETSVLSEGKKLTRSASL
ncbi:hypothetical protein GLAREA_12438 [Glarea lozoyensis ATCC 20868]|uniref:Uncharacterized protein n=1 Tax=Glarea lozoyensis (strain ATCC 20868 / MF5171) TaxID=1116229 RepID=S3CZI2_GLAL2|nr:uncharacterized protein GLAREA_12438 [Glarea lozoyensis ATCC 20868]EPE31682.1 hypothetical protein GLAREA_12438 [Glarea lozoyensis ATCC 20868]